MHYYFHTKTFLNIRFFIELLNFVQKLFIITFGIVFYCFVGYLYKSFKYLIFDDILLLGVESMRKKLILYTLVFGVIVIFLGANAVSSLSVKNSDEHLINIETKDNTGHFYFLVDFTVTVRDTIFCNYWIFDIQGHDFIPFFSAIRSRGSYGDPVVDIKVKKMNGKSYEFTLSNRVLILAYMLKDVETNLPRFGNAHEGYFEGHAVFLTFR